MNWTILAVIYASLHSFGATPPAIDTFTPARFTIEYSKSLAHKKPAITLEVPGDLHVRTVVDGKTYNTFLDNAYWEYVGALPELKSVLARTVKTTLALYSAGITVDINRIVPIIKPRGFLQDSMNIAPDSSADTDTLPVIFDAYNDRLIVLYGQDVRTHITYFGPMELKKACIGRNDLREIAVNNLTQFLPQIKTLEDNGVFMVSAGGRYEASIILCTKFWTRMQFPVNGEIVIAIPSPDIVLVTGKADKQGKKKISAMACKLMKESRCPLVEDLFVLDSGTFRTYRPDSVSGKGKTGGKTGKKKKAE